MLNLEIREINCSNMCNLVDHEAVSIKIKGLGKEQNINHVYWAYNVE